MRVDTDDRSLIFGDTEVRILGEDSAVMHIDTDEANAAGISGIVKGCLVDVR